VNFAAFDHLLRSRKWQMRTSMFSPSEAGQVHPDDARPFEVYGKKQAVRAQITKRSSNCGAKAVSLVP